MPPVASILSQILADTAREVERRAAQTSIAQLQALPGYAEPRRDFHAALALRARRVNLLAEVKRASPSAGLIRADFQPAEIARAYAAGGAAALSVLTDEKYFDGRLSYLAEVRTAVALPLLRKDFLLSEWQLHESRAYGADAILLIAEAHPTARLLELAAAARALGLFVLLEVHDDRRLAEINASFAPAQRGGILLGINNRDLARQVTDLGHFERLAPQAGGWPLVAESGIRTPADAVRMQAAGASAILVGESLMRQGDLAQAVRNLLGE